MRTKTLVVGTVTLMTLVGCGGDDGGQSSETTGQGAGATTIERSSEGSTTIVDSTTAPGASQTTAAGSSSGGKTSNLMPGKDLNLCQVFTKAEMEKFSGLTLEEGEPFYSGEAGSSAGTNSCEWESTSDSAIGTVSIRLQPSSTWVSIARNPYPITGLGDQAEVNPALGTTEVIIGEIALTTQTNGATAQTPSVAAAHPDLKSTSEPLVGTNDVHASLAIAEAWVARLGR